MTADIDRRRITLKQQQDGSKLYFRPATDKRISSRKRGQCL
jgi:hypothetical protein